MSKIGKYTLMILVAVAMTGVISCEEKIAPQNTAPMVKKKITGQNASPAAKSSAPSGEQAEGIPSPAAPAASADQAANGAAKDASGEAEASALIAASLKIASSYDPEGRFDPFQSLFKEEPSAPEAPTKMICARNGCPRPPWKGLRSAN